MTVAKVEGFCDPKFSKLGDIFFKAIKSGFDDGAAPVSYTHLTLPTNREV